MHESGAGISLRIDQGVILVNDFASERIQCYRCNLEDPVILAQHCGLTVDNNYR